MTPPHDYIGVVTLDTAKFTRADYERLPEGFPAQLIDGRLVRNPSPTIRHQRIVGELFINLLEVAGEGRVCFAPLDVFIDDLNVLQPDILVFAESPANETREVPIPVLVAEVLSPETARWDKGFKARTYLAAGVREVWLVDPIRKEIEIRAKGQSVKSRDTIEAVSLAVPGFRVIPADLL